MIAWMSSSPKVSTVRAHPQIAVFIFKEAAHCIAREAVLLCEGAKPTRLRIEFIQPILPPRVPPWWQVLDAKRHTGLAPRPTPGCSLRAERVRA